MQNKYYPFINQPLPYDYQALEPFIDEKTMHLHHDRHLQTYIDNLNAILEKEPKLQRLSLTQLIQISGRLPCPLQTSIRNNAGGVYNHRFFFKGWPIRLLRPPKGHCCKPFARNSEVWMLFWKHFKMQPFRYLGQGMPG